MCQYANMQMCQLSGYLFHIVANRNQQFPVGFAVVAVLFADVAAVGDFLGISLGINADGSSRRIDCTDQPGKIKETLLIRFVYTKLQMRDSSVLYSERFRSFPVEGRLSVSGKSEIVVVCPAKNTFTPTAFDGRLCQYDIRIQLEMFLPAACAAGRNCLKNACLSMPIRFQDDLRNRCRHCCWHRDR